MPIMFEIDENNLPFVRTRQALLVLDLQNQFLIPGSPLAVEQPSGFVDNILKLMPEFRTSGNVIWIRSIFEASRSYNEPGSGSEKIVTDKELAQGSQSPRPRPSGRILERFTQLAAANVEGADIADLLAASRDQDEPFDEAFLTVPEGEEPRFVLPQSPAANIAAAAAIGYDSGKDITNQKSHYSAFKDGTLVQTLRSRFVTELYICGALSNISVFATALDAAQFGYAITVVDDCLGYRSKARHDEALKRLVDSTGCDIMSSKEIIQELRQKARAAQRPPPAPKPRMPPSRQREKKVREPELESMMSKLNLKPEANSSSSRAEPNPTGSTLIVAESPTAPTKESNGSSESTSLDSPDAQLAAIRSSIKSAGSPDKPPDRVQTKIKARRRPARPGNDSTSANGSSANPGKKPVSTNTTLQGASERLSELPKAIPEESDQKGITEKLTTISISKMAANEEKSRVEKINGTSIEVPKKSEPQSQDKSSNTVISAKPSKATREHTNGKSSDTSSKSTPGSDPQLKTLADRAPSTDEPGLCEGDTFIVKNLLSEELADGIFEKIRDEVRWQKMSHQGGEVPRLVAVQGSIAKDGSIPIYRHPADESPPLLPFSPTVSLIKAEAEKQLGHPLNHVLIQFYRDGLDYISEHSDKTLDIVPKTFIVNVSLGAQRTMIFRTKRPETSTKSPEDSTLVKPREAVRAPLPHNSMCKVGLRTNMRWLHAIRQDKRLPAEKSDAELAFNGARISLTFRQIGTFLSKDQQTIWGQGATSKTKEGAKSVINGNTAEAEKMVRAFGKENHSSQFDWAASYGEGFDVLHMDNTPKLFLSGDKTADLRVKIALAEYGIEWAEGKLSPSFNWKDGSSKTDAPAVPEVLPVRYVDNDLGKSAVTGDTAILLYLDSVYGSKTKPQADLARQFTRLLQVGDLQKKWSTEPFSIKPFKRELELWNSFAKENEYIASKDASIVDWLLFPVLDDIYKEWGLGDGLESLAEYYKTMKGRKCIIKAFGDVEAKEVPKEEEAPQKT